MRFDGRRFPIALAFLDDPVEVVNRVQVKVAQITGAGLDVAWYRNVSREFRLALACFERVRDLLGGYHGLCRRGRGNQDVGLRQRAFDLRQGQGEAAKLSGEILRALHTAIGNKQASDFMADQVLGNELDRHARTDQQRGVFLEAREELLLSLIHI